MELLNELGSRIKQIRETKNISQSRLSELSGIVREQISRIENGQINATVESIYKLSLGLNITMSEMLDLPKDVLKLIANSHSLDLKTKPFVKWAGGKTQLLKEIKSRMPNEFNNYFEPFIGGGALLFDLKPNYVTINDFNSELIAAYKCFQNEEKYNTLLLLLDEHEKNHSEEYYLKVREMDRNENFKNISIEKKAARFMYLNKSCFNGLYRVNSKGYFNVPSGKKEKVNIYDRENLKGIFTYFSNNNINVLNSDFAEAVKEAKKGDFVYFDPPYDSYDEKESFTSYSKNGFDKDDQLRLSKVFKELDNIGVKVMLSNHNTSYIQELYKDFKIDVVLAKRMINSKASGRGNVEEVIITNY